MKKLRITTLAALAGVLLSTIGAQAAYNNGDLLLGFRSDTGTQDYIVDLGPASQFTPTTPLFTLSIGSIGSDLSSSSLFGANWFSRSDLYWSLVGTDLAGDPSNTLYASRPQSPVGTPATPWSRRTNSAQSTTNSVIRGAIAGFNNEDIIGLNPNSKIQGVTDTYTSGSPWVFYTSPSTDFSVWNGIEGNFTDGTAGTVLDVFRLTPTSQAAGDIYLGSFSINNDGAISFIGAQAVPEPSTYAMLALGLGGLALAQKRRRQSQATA